MFGTDLPSTRAPRLFLDADLSSISEALDPGDAAMALYDNAVALYAPRSRGG